MIYYLGPIRSSSAEWNNIKAHNVLPNWDEYPLFALKQVGPNKVHVILYRMEYLTLTTQALVLPSKIVDISEMLTAISRIN